MKRIICFLSLLLSLSALADDKVKCNQGDQTPPEQNDSIKIPTDSLTSQSQLSYDPNEIIGPEGYDSVRWVSINDVLNYTILFENDPEFATAAAQKVDVRFDIPNKAWMKGFGIGGYSFSNMSFSVAKTSNAYQQRIDLKDSLGYYVDLIAGLDVARQQGFWTFSTIDPETGYAPWQAEMGLLPVNDSTHVGEGFVTFQLKPYEGLHTGDTISIQASIVFDQNDTIPTNRWTNKIDAGMPESRVAPLSSPQGGTADNAYELSFIAKDDEGGSGVKHLLLYMANHNGIYEEIDTVAVDSVLLFPVEAGKQYKLYSIAVDNTGNREPAKMEPDVILNFNLAPTDIALSDTIFQDDLAAGGYVGKLSSIDTEDNKTFTYALAEGDGAIHNDLFQVTDDKLQIKNSFKCAEGEIFNIRLSTTDEGGLSYSKHFALRLKKVLDRPEIDTLEVNICTGETCVFHGTEYDKAGFYAYTKSNDFACDSVYVLKLNVLQPIEAPLVTVEDTHTLVSSAAKGNQWFKEDGTPVENANEQKFTPTEEGVYYVAASNGSCYSEPSKRYRVRLTNAMALTLNLAEGWNWISANLSDEQNMDVMTLLTPITDYADELKSQVKGIIKDTQYGWFGNLSTIAPAEGYKIRMNQNSSHTWEGKARAADKTPITLQKGWNWIGYVPSIGTNLTDALNTLEPSEGEMLNGFDDFSVFHQGSWVGTLTTMEPGLGYMYQADESKTFKYPNSHTFAVEDATQEVKGWQARPEAPWHVNKHAYPDNMPLIGQVYVNNALAPEGLYTVGAFVDGECRGIGQYVAGRLFLTVHGITGADDDVCFKAYDNVTDQILTIAETCRLDGNSRGTMASPFALNIDYATDIEQMAQTGYQVYPNPVRDKLFINGKTDDINVISIISTSGAKVMTMRHYPSEGIDVSHLADGAYIVVLNVQDTTITQKIIKNAR